MCRADSGIERWIKKGRVIYEGTYLREEIRTKPEEESETDSRELRQRTNVRIKRRDRNRK